MATRLFVCVTCDRHAARHPGEAGPGERLAAAIRQPAADAGVTVRTVECLNGCLRPCTAALRDPGKAVLRFSGLLTEDAAALVAAASLYAASLDGKVAAGLPPGLRDKLATGAGMAA
jgi:predicted metal-binding protein